VQTPVEVRRAPWFRMSVIEPSLSEAARRNHRGRANLPRAAPSAELKALYRTAARRFHPDLAEDDADRERRTELMARVNAAYGARDADVLRHILDSPDVDEGNGNPARTARGRALRPMSAGATRRAWEAELVTTGLPWLRGVALTRCNVGESAGPIRTAPPRRPRAIHVPQGRAPLDREQSSPVPRRRAPSILRCRG
jgi:hypothetical protein